MESFGEFFLETIEDFKEVFLNAALILKPRVESGDVLTADDDLETALKDAYLNHAKVLTFRALEPYDRFLAESFLEQKYSLNTRDMQQVAAKINSEFEHLDTVRHTRHGNECFSLRYGVIIASIIGKNYILREIRDGCQRCEALLRNVYPIYLQTDIAALQGDKAVIEAVGLFDCELHDLGELCWRETEKLKHRINCIDEGTDYFAKHIFATGLTEFPGIGYELQYIKQLCSNSL